MPIAKKINKLLFIAIFFAQFYGDGKTSNEKKKRRDGTQTYLDSYGGQLPLGCGGGLIEGDADAHGLMLGLGGGGSGGDAGCCGGGGGGGGGRRGGRGGGRQVPWCRDGRCGRGRGWRSFGALSQAARTDATEAVAGVAAARLAVGFAAAVLLVQVGVLGRLGAALQRHRDEGLGCGAGRHRRGSLPIAYCSQEGGNKDVN